MASSPGKQIAPPRPPDGGPQQAGFVLRQLSMNVPLNRGLLEGKLGASSILDERWKGGVDQAVPIKHGSGAPDAGPQSGSNGVNVGHLRRGKERGSVVSALGSFGDKEVTKRIEHTLVHMLHNRSASCSDSFLLSLLPDARGARASRMTCRNFASSLTSSTTSCSSSL